MTPPELGGMHLITALLPRGQIYPAGGDGRGIRRSLAWTSVVILIYLAGVTYGAPPLGYGMIGDNKKWVLF